METTFDASRIGFVLVVAFERHIVLYTGARIDRDSIPEGLQVYEVSHNPNDDCELHYIARKIRKWFAGTLISNTSLDLSLGGTAAIEKHTDFNYTDIEMTLADYMRCCPPQLAIRKIKSGENQNG